LEYTLDALPESIDEVIVVVGYLGGMIHDHFGPEYFGKKMLYVEQEELNGTAGALWLAKDVLKDRFLVIHGDDIYARSDMEKMGKVKDWAFLVKKMESMREGGRVVTDAHGGVVDIVEGVHDGQPGLIHTGMYTLDTRLFSANLVPKAAKSPEFGLPQTVLAAAHALDIPLQAITASQWIKITDQADLKKAEETLSA
ncbi:MAG TPA: sugar phosphate nucleotidyltransferase, partial [Candidatus Paceibacterota bacterium]|nr:sugar phosphate nucleotidyltransferase [Candidatus Paceibacterota bacterium]